MNKTAKKKFKISGMHCASCALTIDMEVEELKGVKSSNTSYAKQLMEIEVDEEVVKLEQITQAVNGLGYTIELSD